MNRKIGNHGETLGLAGPSFLQAHIVPFHLRALLNVLVGLIFLSLTSVKAIAKDNELQGKLIVGYQGWFAPEGDGMKLKWIHYGAGHFGPGSCVIDMWPDLTGFDADERYPTDFRFADGQIAPVFSSANAKTVDRHFQWMQDYGIDGAALQRFGTNLQSEHMRAWRDRVLDNCRKAADAHGRLWLIMYDISGLHDDELMSVVAADWQRLIDKDDFRNDPNYIRQGGKPLVAVWGVGFTDREYTSQACQKLIEFFKGSDRHGGNAVMLGVPYFWRTGTHDSIPTEELHPLLKLADVISPWSVGRYNKIPQAEKIGQSMIAPDMAWCKENGLTYLPVFYPGFSWQNLEKSHGREAPLYAIPRENGAFLWAQAASAIHAGARSGYVAMFDEMDEGTCIFKVTNQPPIGASQFATYEGLPSDHYLWLTGEIARALRSPGSVSSQMPSRLGNSH
jgi:hypothetical protein